MQVMARLLACLRYGLVGISLVCIVLWLRPTPQCTVVKDADPLVEVGGRNRRSHDDENQHDGFKDDFKDYPARDDAPQTNYKKADYYREVGTQLPLIFIGGVPRSGTTLMRAMLDAHPSVRCGQETRVVPRILAMRSKWRRSALEHKRLEEAGVNDRVLDAATAAFMIEVIAGHGEPAPRLCTKDPFILKSTDYLTQLFPHSKFLLMLRDGRATVHSIISRKVTITGFNLKKPRQCLEMWDKAVSNMYDQCYNASTDRCLPVHYEQLVLHPETQLRRVLEFLGLPFNRNVLHHERFVGKETSVSKVERSTDQIIKPVNVEALSKWVGHFPDDVVKDMAEIAPMLEKLGYDPLANPPNYGTADAHVVENTAELQRNKAEWERKVVDLIGTTRETPTRAPAPTKDGEPVEVRVGNVMMRAAQ